MTANERLRSAMAAALFDIEGVASSLTVDPKTVQRWIAGRTPRPRHRWALADLLSTDDEELWPGASASLTGRGHAPDRRLADRDDGDTQDAVVASVGLRPHIERAFQRPHVTIDFAGFSGETLHGVLQEPLDKIRVGLLAPETIVIRMLVADTSRPMGLPCRVADLADDPDFRERASAIMRRHHHDIAESLRELADLGLVTEACTQLRRYNGTPLFKLYLLGDTEAFFGFYPLREHSLHLNGELRSVYDLMGKDAVLFRQVRSDDETAPGSRYVVEARRWFESMWTMVSREFTP